MIRATFLAACPGAIRWTAHANLVQMPITSSGPAAYTPMCSGSLPSCTYALSTEVQLVAGPAATLTAASIAGTALTFASNTGTVAANQLVSGAGVSPGTYIVSGSALSWTIDTAHSQTVGPVTMTTVMAAIQVERSVDSTVQNIGYTVGGLVDTSQVDAFCNAAVSGVISRQCYLSEIFDQGPNLCHVYNSTFADIPYYMVNPTHGGLPLFAKTTQASAALVFLLDSNGGSTGALSAPCNLLTGGAQSMFFAGNTKFASSTSGNFGLMENTPGVVTGAMFAAFQGLDTLAIGACSSGANPCLGLDTEGQGVQANGVVAANLDNYMVATYHGSSTKAENIWENGTQVLTNNTSIGTPLATQARMTWGSSGNHTNPGPSMAYTQTFYASELSSGQVAAINANEAALLSALTTPYQGPLDLFMVASTNSVPANGKADQFSFVQLCLSLTKCYAGYEGPALYVCKGQTVTGAGNCEDIGWVNNIIDTATMSAFCGPVSGLNNCAVSTWYNQGINNAPTTNAAPNTLFDAVAASVTERPLILWTGCQTTNVSVCISTNSTHWFALSSPATGIGNAASGGLAYSAVATRTGGNTSSSMIYSSATGTGPGNFIGFNNAVNALAASQRSNANIGIILSNTGSSTTCCTDGTIHSATLDSNTTPSAILYVDGVASTAYTANPPTSTSSGIGIGATGAGADSCICQISEVMVMADQHSTAFASALGSTNVAALRANQRSRFGF